MVPSALPVSAAAPDLQLPDWQGYTLVGLTTEPNTANLVAAAHLGVKRYVALETAAAIRSELSSGLRAVLATPGRQVECRELAIPAGAEQRVGALEAFLRATLADGRMGEPGAGIIWGLGGSRAQQIALFEIFRMRSTAGAADFALYPDTRRKKLTLMRMAPGGGLLEVEQEMNARLTIQELASCLGYDVADARPLPEPRAPELYERFRSEPAYRREWLTRRPVSHAGHLASKAAPTTHLWDLVGELKGSAQVMGAMRERLRNELSSRPTAHKRVAAALSVLRSKLEAASWALKGGGGKARKALSDAPKLFEDMARTLEQIPDIGGEAQRENLARSLLNAAFHPKIWAEATGWTGTESAAQETPLGSFGGAGAFFEALVTHRVCGWLRSAGANGIVAARSDVRFLRKGRPVAQHDFLLATRDGVLTSLDCKLFELSGEELASRLLRLRSISGPAVTTLPVLPWFPGEMDSDGTSERLRSLPFELSALKLGFAVVSSTDAAFWARRDPADGRKIERLARKEPGWLACETLEHLLEKLGRP